jgi:hypothetical protein|tara:strand:+ start:2233 stop:2856 length:624 start_codon:yes stop_codon:yes gene_type:complete
MDKKLGFRMKHNNDSIASVKAWKEHKAGYLKKPGGQKEYDMEKGEFFYSPKHKKLRLIPTDDGEMQDKSGIEKWQLAPDRQSSQEEVYNMTPDATEEESKAVRDKFDRTYMKGGKKYKKGDLLSEDDFDSQGTNYNIQDVTEVQSDDKGQFVTTLGDDEITPSLQSGKNPKFSSDSTIMPNALRPNVRVARDTIRPSIGKYFTKRNK